MSQRILHEFDDVSTRKAGSILWNCCGRKGHPPGLSPVCAPGREQGTRGVAGTCQTWLCLVLCFWLQFSLMVTFPEVPLGIFLFCMCVITIGAVQVGPPQPAFPPTRLSSWYTHLPHVWMWRVSHSKGCACGACCRVTARALCHAVAEDPEIARAWASCAGCRGSEPCGVWWGKTLWDPHVALGVEQSRGSCPLCIP